MEELNILLSRTVKVNAIPLKRTPRKKTQSFISTHIKDFPFRTSTQQTVLTLKPQKMQKDEDVGEGCSILECRLSSPNGDTGSSRWLSAAAMLLHC
jgi:hypothetical protein